MTDLSDALLCCPRCRANLVRGGEAITCAGCGLTFSFSGVPVLLSSSSGLGERQASFFDHEVDWAFEVRRPENAPRLYGWLLREKFERSVRGIDLRGATVFVVCGGSGMEAEFLARRGAYVVSSDISLGAAQRSEERRRSSGFRWESVVCDATCLPLRDRSVDFAYVHDGLHHLEDPLDGLKEMVRVARRGVIVSEPAKGLLTSLAIALGVAQEEEEAGNPVGRLNPALVEGLLNDLGMNDVRRSRYLMFYRHHPGLAMRLFSCRGLFLGARLVVSGVNRIAGSSGNKLVVQGFR